MIGEVEAMSALWLSLKVGLVATAVALLPAAALAWWLARTASRLRALVEALVILPLVLPPVVVGYFLLAWFGRHGLFGVNLAFTWFGAALAAMVMGFPLMVRTMRQGFEAIDPGIEEAAAVLGAGRMRVLWTITLPMAMRSIVAGAALCFARSLGEFGATITFAGNVPGETRTLPLAIWTALKQVDGDATARGLTWICVGVAVAATVLCELLVRGAHGRRSR